MSITAYSTLGEDIGSGSLLSNGLDILTAAHVVWDDILDQPVGSVDVSFDLPTGRFTVSSSDIIVNPGWNPNDLGVGDVAIIVLPGIAPAAAERYTLYTGAEIGALAQIMTIVGYGVTGSGTAGETGTDAGNVKNSAENVYQADGSSFNTIPWTQLGVDQAGTPDFAPGSLLCYCFYNGVAANDAFKILFGVNSAFLGNAEGSSAPRRLRRADLPPQRADRRDHRFRPRAGQVEPRSGRSQLSKLRHGQFRQQRHLLLCLDQLGHGRNVGRPQRYCNAALTSSPPGIISKNSGRRGPRMGSLICCALLCRGPSARTSWCNN